MQIFQPVLFVSLTPECIMTIVGPRHCASSALWLSNPVPFILDSGSQFIRDSFQGSVSWILSHSIYLFILLPSLHICRFQLCQVSPLSSIHFPSALSIIFSLSLWPCKFIPFQFCFPFTVFLNGVSEWSRDLSFLTAINLSISRATSYFCLPKWKKQVKLVCKSRASSVWSRTQELLLSILYILSV